jgi:hypothetical protein
VEKHNVRSSVIKFGNDRCRRVLKSSPVESVICQLSKPPLSYDCPRGNEAGQLELVRGITDNHPVSRVQPGSIILGHEQANYRHMSRTRHNPWRSESCGGSDRPIAWLQVQGIGRFPWRTHMHRCRHDCTCCSLNTCRIRKLTHVACRERTLTTGGAKPVEREV